MLRVRLQHLIKMHLLIMVMLILLLTCNYIAQLGGAKFIILFQVPWSIALKRVDQF